ncbi:small G protein signaling modulator 1-like [Suricata suricatta]|uniref:small G protein signaling modulator 1-like n=1 Tax=Suricata suricatta TaxID=37032 RepID=UPI0011553768|nr:small G protein signaling modulator 1-like [Suricata suricatta]
MKTADHCWTDLSADELVLGPASTARTCGRTCPPTTRPALCIQKRHSSGRMDDRPSCSARDYVESLHQNSRAALLHGKNHVLVQPVRDTGTQTFHRGSGIRLYRRRPLCLRGAPPSIHPSIRPPIHLSIYFPVLLSIHLSTQLPIHLFSFVTAHSFSKYLY